MDHDRDHPADYLATILKEVDIAMVALFDPTKFSYGVLRFCRNRLRHDPVNLTGGGDPRWVYESLAAIDRRWTWWCSVARCAARDRTRGDRDLRQGAVDAARR
jgi:hypothetical protein